MKVKGNGLEIETELRRSTSEEALEKGPDLFPNGQSNLISNDSANSIVNKSPSRVANDDLSSLSSESKVVKKKIAPFAISVKRSTSLHKKQPNVSGRNDRITKYKLPASKCDVIPLMKKYVGVARNAKKTTSLIKGKSHDLLKKQQQLRTTSKRDKQEQSYVKKKPVS